MYAPSAHPVPTTHSLHEHRLVDDGGCAGCAEGCRGSYAGCQTHALTVHHHETSCHEPLLIPLRTLTAHLLVTPNQHRSLPSSINHSQDITHRQQPPERTRHSTRRLKPSRNEDQTGDGSCLSTHWVAKPAGPHATKPAEAFMPYFWRDHRWKISLTQTLLTKTDVESAATPPGRKPTEPRYSTYTLSSPRIRRIYPEN